MYFEFSSGVTAIVGPNGSGKSNIADALRWVLGEQSYSLLRGKKTEDMIFSGSEHRPKSGMASAEIIFDNAANWLPLDFPEVALGRRAYRDGHNEYVLNGKQVRLREMNELLAATGLSERTYTIVGQGLVDASLALKADERRRLFEEAAGVGLYRVRREEAVKRLEATERNLERVLDILAEIEPRLKSLERQAKRANEYAAAQADLREVLREWYGYHWNTAQADLQAAQELARQARSQAGVARAEYEASQLEHHELRGKLSTLRMQLASWHREAEALDDERESLDRSLAVAEERRRAIEENRAALVADTTSLHAEHDVAAHRLQVVASELSSAESDSAAAAGELAAAQEVLRARESGRGELQERLQSARAAVAEANARKAEARAHLDLLEHRLDSLRSRAEQAAKSADDARTELLALESVASAADAALAAAVHLYENAAAQLAEKTADASNLEAHRRRLTEEIARLDASYLKVSAQLEAIIEAESTFVGYAEGTKFLLEAARDSRLDARGAFGRSLQIPVEYEEAIAAALGDAAQAVVLAGDQVDSALDLLRSHDVPRAALLAVRRGGTIAMTAPNDADVVGVAAELVKCESHAVEAVKAVLGHVIVVRDRSAARRLLTNVPPHAVLVTLTGEIFRPDGLIMAGKSTSVSLLSRTRQRTDLENALLVAGTKLEQTRAVLERVSSDATAAQLERQSLESRLLDVQRDRDVALGKRQESYAELDRRRRNAQWLLDQSQIAARDVDAAEAEQAEIAGVADAQSARSEGAEVEVQRLAHDLEELTTEQAQQQVAYWSTRAAVAQQTLHAVTARHTEQGEVLLRVESRQLTAENRAAELSAAVEGLDAELQSSVARRQAVQALLDEIRARISPAESEIAKADLEEQGVGATQSEAERLATATERALSQSEIELVRRQEALESLRTRIVDDFGLVSFEYASGIEGAVPLPFDGLIEALPRVDELKPELEEQLSQKRGRLRRLGLINPEAATEYSAESERFTSMTAQVQDLQKAEADLRGVIAELDELTRQDFSRTYAAVDKEFRQIFTRLFGGGSARLALTDPNNLVETGIDIEARLPGRREQGLSLLSGGERSLTAIALVFALLKVAPTPLCVLDEVDAMLDEANVGRFRDLLKELSGETQFIVITHNRNTVQAADYIYGVTMGRDSSSQIISLRLDEISEEMLGTSRM